MIIIDAARHVEASVGYDQDTGLHLLDRPYPPPQPIKEEVMDSCRFCVYFLLLSDCLLVVLPLRLVLVWVLQLH